MFTQSLDLKQRNPAKSRPNESTLCTCIHEHSFGGLGVDTLTFCELTPFSGVVGGGGGLSAVSKAELRFPILFVEPQVCAM
jgi:hypothetical protein